MVSTLSEMAKLWAKTLKKIQARINDDRNFDYFFANSYIYGKDGDTLIIVVQRDVAKVVIEKKYLNVILESLSDLEEDSYKVRIVTEEEVNRYKDTSKSPAKEETSPGYFQSAKIDPNLRFDNFVVGEFNKDAHKAAQFVAKNGGTMFNPLFIYSHPGLGKTHLLCAIGNDIKEHRMPDAKILYINASDFVDEYVKFVRGEKESQSLKDFFKTVDVLLLDDIQTLSGKVKTEEMLFLVYQDMIAKGKRIIITSDRQPNELRGLEERLVSRFTQGLTVKINEPDTETCVEILKSKIMSLGLKPEKFDANVLYFLAEKYSRDVRELQGAINKFYFDYLGLDEEQTITMDIALKALAGIKGGKVIASQVDEQKIINIVADYYNFTPSQLTGKDRNAQIILARHIAMYLIRSKLTDISLDKIGKTFGGKDHTTVMSAIKKVDKELKTNKELQAVIEELNKKIGK